MCLACNNPALASAEVAAAPWCPHLWCLQMTLVLKVPPPAACWHSRPFWRPHVSSPQSLPHVVVLAAPAPEVDPVAVHALKLLPGEDGDASKEILHKAYGLFGGPGTQHELLAQQFSTTCMQLQGWLSQPSTTGWPAALPMQAALQGRAPWSCPACCMRCPLSQHAQAAFPGIEVEQWCISRPRSAQHPRSLLAQLKYRLAWRIPPQTLRLWQS